MEVDSYIYYTPDKFYMDDVPLVQPVGFVWFTKPRYRIKYRKRILERIEQNGKK